MLCLHARHLFAGHRARCRLRDELGRRQFIQQRHDLQTLLARM
jgi:hypothetical protein